MGCFHVSGNPHPIRTHWPGVGVTCRIFPVLLLSHFCRIIKILVTYFNITLHLAAELRWHLSNFNVIQMIWNFEMSLVDTLMDGAAVTPHHGYCTYDQITSESRPILDIHYGACKIRVDCLNNTYMATIVYRTFSFQHSDATWASWCVKSHETQVFVHQFFKISTKSTNAPHYWPRVHQFYRWIPSKV